MSTGRIVGMHLDGFEPARFEDRAVQRRAIDAPLADGDACDLIFDNDGAGEVADVVSLRVTDGLVQVMLHHLQIFKLHDARRPPQGSLGGLRAGALRTDTPSRGPRACPSNRVIRPLLTAIAG
jgi:hypothetical protein